MIPDFSEFKKFPPENFKIFEATSSLTLRNKRTNHLYRISKLGSEWVLAEANFNDIHTWRIFYRSPDLYRVLMLVGYDPKHDYHVWKRGDFDALVKRLQNS